MSFVKMVDFLQRLQKNNSKEWMDANRKEYVAIRDFFIDWLDHMNLELAKVDKDYFNTPGKKAINRINNNLLFHPNRPVYKDHFGAGLDQLSKQGDYYLDVSVSDCFIGGGYWYPSAKQLKSIRDAIDYNGDELLAILNKPGFVRCFGGFIDGDVLVKSPKGYSEDHPNIGLLKRKTFAVGCRLSHKEVYETNFEARVIEIYKEMLPFRRYLNEAVTV